MAADELRPRQRCALQALLMGKTPDEAARLARVTRACLERWTRGPAWQAELAVSREGYGLTDEQLRQRTRRAVLVEATPAVERIATLSRAAETEKVRLHANQFLVNQAVGKAGAAATPDAVIIPTAALEALIQGAHVVKALLEQTREPRPVAGHE